MPLPRPSPPALRLFASSWLVAAAGSAAATAAAEGHSPANSFESRRPQRQRLVRSEAAVERLVVGSRAEVSPERAPKAVRPVLQRLHSEAYDGSRFWHLGKPMQDDFTITLQFRTNSSAGSGKSWLAGVGLLGAARGGLEGGFGLAMGDGKVLFGNGRRTAASSRSYADDLWHTAVASRDMATGACSLWVDGVFQRTITSLKGSLKPSHDMDIGRITSGHGYFVGYLRNVEIYDQVLTPDEIDFAKDVEAKKRRAEEHQPLLEELQVQDFLGDTFREYERFVQDDFTIVLDFKTDSSAGSATHWWAGVGLIGAGAPGASEDFGLSMGGGYVLFGIGNPDTTIISGERYDDDKWHTVVAERTRKSGEFSLWIDGVFAMSAVGSQHSLMGSDHLDVGRLSKGSGYFRGHLRGLRIFGEALTPLDLGMEAVDANAAQGRVWTTQRSKEEAAGADAAPGKVHSREQAADANATQSKVLLEGDSAEAADANATQGKVLLEGASAEAASATKKESWPLLDLQKAENVQEQVHKVSCSGVTAGDRFLQLGSWRLGDADGEHFSVASEPGQAAHVYSSTGTAQSGPSKQHLTWQHRSHISGIKLGDHFIQIGNWRLGEADACHFSISHRSGWVAQVFKCDGTVINGPGRDFSTWSRKTDVATDIAFGDRFVEIGDWRVGAADDRHLSISHFKGKTAMVFRTDGKSFPGNGTITDYDGTWARPAKICSPLLALPTCRGLQVGDRFIQMGKWRLGDVEGVRLSMSHEGGAVAQIWWSNGTIGRGSGPADGHLFHHLTTWNRMLGPASGIAVGDRFVQIGQWRVGEVDDSRFSVSHVQGATAQTFHKNGTVEDSPANSTVLWARPAGDASGVTFGDRFIEIGQWRIGDVDGHHASIAHQRRKTFVIFKNNGKAIRGPREDYTTLSQHTEVCDLLASPAAQCVLTLDNPSEEKRRYSSKEGAGESVLDSYQAWVAQKPRDGEWMEMDLGAVKQVAGIVMQSRVDQKFQWISQYRLNHSKDGKKWNPVLGLFRGATEWFWKSTQTLTSPVFARHLRIYPESWHNNIAGCAAALVCQECRGGSALHNPSEEMRAYTSVLGNGKPGSWNALSKLNSKQAWVSAINGEDEYLQIDLGRAHLVTGVVTQGHRGEADWTTQFAVICSADGNTWDRAGAYFVGNADTDTQVTNTFPYAIWARWLRILPMTWHRNVAMRAGVLACKAPRSPPAALASLATPRRATPLPATARGGADRAKKAVSPEERQTQVLTEPVLPARPVERQAPAPAEPMPLAPKPRPQLLKQTLPLGARQQPPPKLQPTALPPVRGRWKLGRHRRYGPPPALRHPAIWMMVKARGSQRSQRHLSSTHGRGTTTRRRRSISSDNNAEATVKVKECPTTLMNPAEASRSYSSVYSGQQPGEAHARSAVDSEQAWAAGVSRAGEWMQLDLGKLAKVVATVVQGRRDWPQWVTAYRVRCSQDGVHWTEVEKDFEGNTDQSTKVSNSFPHPVQARYVRLVVLSYHATIAMRAAVLVCKDEQSTARRRRSPKVEVETGVEARLTKMGYKRCAKEGQDCACSGIAVYGQGSAWTSLRVDEAVSCSASAFQGADQPVGLDLIRECRCKDLAWCFQAERNGTVMMLHDSEHRRRVASGRMGANNYQRRRMCGWGPRDCLYSPWGDWGDCHEDCLQMRVRMREAPARNGGSCAVQSVDSRPCSSC